MFNNDKFVWFMGVVEDRDDPLKMNRVRVRCFGYHSFDGVNIPTIDLPWATVIMPSTESGTSGIGSSPHGLVIGSWVIGFFRDGPDAQDPIIMGSIASTSTNILEITKAAGILDEYGHYPKDKYLTKSDVNEHGREETTDLVDKKKATVTTGVSIANGVESDWNEPKTPYAPVYPYNKVQETESGHLFETDDTIDAERIHQYHKSGTFEEIHPDGTRVTRIVLKDYEIVYDDKNVNIKGNCNITVNANSTLYVNGDMDVQINGDLNETIKGNVVRNVYGSSTTTVQGNYARNSGTHIEDNAPRIDHN